VKIGKYRVWWTNRHSSVVSAFGVSGARRQAWDSSGHFKYGWKRADFLKNATVDKLD